MSEWKEYKIHEIGKVITGTTPSSKNPEDFGSSTMFVTPSDYKSYTNYIKMTVRYLSDVGREKLKSRILPRGSVMVTCIGSDMGKVALNPEEVITNQQVNSIIPNSNVNNIFLYYKLKDEYDTLRMYGGEGTAVPIVNKSTFENIELLFPPLPEQERIAEILSSLDDKIDLLHRNNNTLEQFAETLFRQWFVEEAEDEVNEISLSDISKHVKKSVNPSKTPDQFFKHYSLPAFDNGRNPEIQLGRDILSNKYQISPGQILISKLNPRTPRVWFINSCTNYSICSTEFQVYEPIKKEYTEFIFCFLKSNDTRDILTGASSGTSGSHQRVNPEDINNLTIKKPNQETLNRFHQITSVWLNKIDKNSIQIQQLETLRDTLLPKLMSGVVRVSER